MSKFPFHNTSINFPLARSPYNSRIESSEIITNEPKNYVMHGFRPGFPLQASELNEVQDKNNVNSSLYMTMNYYWKDNLPGWLGTCPLWPEKVSPDVDPLGPTTNIVEKIKTGTTVSIYANEGWYNVYSNQTGFRHWIYLNKNLSVSGITPDPENTTYVGFDISYTEIKATEDSSLYDNSSTNLVAGTPAGANRFKINILNEVSPSALLTVTTNPIADLKFSPIVKIRTDFIDFAQYLNNKSLPNRP